MRLSSRRSDDADLIRARLRVLLDQSNRPRGWVPEDLPEPGDLDEDEEEDEEDSEPDEALPSGLGRHRAPSTAVRLDPGRRGARSLWIAAVLAAVLLAAWTWLDRPRVEPVEPSGNVPASSSAPDPPASPSVGETATTASTVVASVVGLVVRPGLVTLPQGARVADAVEAAGGLLPGADPASVNLAAVVTDGQQVAVGVPGAAPAGAGTADGGGSGPVDLNTATAADLDELPGIGPVLAQRIVDFRDQQGRFSTVDQLQDVPGIGPAIYGELQPLVTV